MTCLSELLTIQNELVSELDQLELALHDPEIYATDGLYVLSEIIDVKRLLLRVHLEISEFIPKSGRQAFSAESTWA